MIVAATLNMHKVDWDTSFSAVQYSNALTVTSLVLFIVLCPFFITLYCRNFKILPEPRFKRKYGAGLVGTKVESEQPTRYILAYPVFFFARRIIFVVSVVFFGDFLGV